LKKYDDLPAWHPKRQKGYKASRVLMWVQIVLALAMAALIWFGMKYAMGA
jgi:type VI protein secretion system component VasF